MTHAGIECFLAVCRHKTGSAAAQALYITQSSLSTRLKTLEKELGGRLFHRKKGSREMSLTPAGKEFYELALQYETLVDKMQQVCRRNQTTLRISSVNSLATYILPAVYELFLPKQPGVHLELQDMKLPEVGNSIQSGDTDWALTAGKATDNTLLQTPIFSEPMVLIYSHNANYSEPSNLAFLPLDEEVYIQWNEDFAKWHQQFFGKKKSQIQVSIMAHLKHFMERERCWAIVPVSVAYGLQKEGCIHSFKINDKLPRRIISLLASSKTGETAAYNSFVECLHQVVSRYPGIEILCDK